MDMSTYEQIGSTTEIKKRSVSVSRLPEGVVLRERLGIVASEHLDGQIVHRARDPEGGLYECRATIAPNGDFLLMFPDGGHYGGKSEKVNDMLAYRSSDGGVTWQGPHVAFDIDYNQHGFIPLTPHGTNRIYAFGTQPVWDDERINGLKQSNGLHENAPIGFRHSDDNGHTWSKLTQIAPVNDPGFRGMSVMRMCETDAGTWLLGSHEADWSYKPLMTRQYILRSEDRGQTWNVAPYKRHGGWCVPQFNRMDEGRPVNLGNGGVFLMTRTCEGHLWGLWSEDDGRTWTHPQPTPLVHPDAPPMLCHLSDGKTLVAFHHNRYSDFNYTGLSAEKSEVMKDRSEIWLATSTDGGHTWSEPRFVFANALSEAFSRPFRNFQCSYMDCVVSDGTIHLFVPHRWQRVLHLTIAESHILNLIAENDLQ